VMTGTGELRMEKGHGEDQNTESRRREVSNGSVAQRGKSKDSRQSVDYEVCSGKWCRFGQKLYVIRRD